MAPVDVPNRLQLLKHCALHSTVSATPSLIFAYMIGWNKASQLLGMITGVALFIITAWLLHLSRPLVVIRESPYASKALAWTKNIRMAQVIAMLPAIPVPFLAAILLASDIWAGGLANFISYSLPVINQGPASVKPTMPEQPALLLFLQALLATYIEGFILAAGMSVLFVLLWIALRIRGRAHTVQ